MADESTDVTNREQLVKILIHTRKLLACMKLARSMQRHHVLKDILLRLGLDEKKMRGQCYDGCSTMMGEKMEWQSKLNEILKSVH